MTDLNAPYDPILAESVANRFTIRSWCRAVRAGISVWQPRQMPSDYRPTPGELDG